MVTYLSFVEFILFSWTGLFFGCSFNESYHTPECQFHSEDKLLLFFAFSARYCFGIWVSFISPNYVFGFSKSKGNSLCVFILWRSHGNSYASSPGDEWTATNYASSLDDEWMATNLSSVVWKFTTDFLGGLFLGIKYRRSCLPADTHMANRKWDSPTPTSPCNEWEGGRERLDSRLFALQL